MDRGFGGLFVLAVVELRMSEHRTTDCEALTLTGKNYPLNFVHFDSAADCRELL